jgi:D-alanine--poly(phosphoribitol) ligase subunit 2
MSITKDQIVSLIYEVIDEENEAKDEGKRIVKSLETLFLSKDRGLDSLGLVSLIVATEERIVDSFDVEITIADAKAMSQKNSPFRSVNSLADYILKLLS